MASPKKLLARALQQHQAGDLMAAGQLYRKVLDKDPKNVDALNLLGTLLLSAGQAETAVELLARATDLAPDYFAPFVNFGNALQTLGRTDEAVTAFETARRLEPKSAEAAANHASALGDAARHADALDAATEALRLQPGMAAGLNNMGNALLGLGRAEEARQRYAQALTLTPGDASAHYNMGNALMDLGDPATAAASFKRATALDPKDAEKHFNLGNALSASHLYDEAIQSFEKALALDPAHVAAHCNLAADYQATERSAEAVQHLMKAVALEPDSADLHWNLALAHLQGGNMEDGWAEYEWRWRTETFKPHLRGWTAPTWTGEDLGGGTLFIHTEQGFGDALRFCRFASLAADRAGRVVLECRPPLTRLLAALDGVDQAIDLGAEPPAHDAQVALLSLPHVFETTLETLPADVPYLAVPTDATPPAAITEAGAGLKVGFVWAGSATRQQAQVRDCEVRMFEPLMRLPDCRFFSLQVGDGAADLKTLADDIDVADLAPGLKDFADTAATIAALDLVITVDTAVLHLAAALGRPTWGLMSKPTGYFWMEGLNDSPWYSTLRLFRQPEPGDWESVFGEAEEALGALLAER